MQLHVVPVTSFVENTYILSDEKSKEAIIFDPGGEAERILGAVQELGLIVKYILNTHGHIDHIGAVKKVREGTGATWGIHANDFAMTQRDPAGYALRLIPDYVQPPEPDMFVKEGDEFTIGDITVKTIETPGHTMGSICFLAEGILISGDTLFQGSVGRTDFPGSSTEALVKSIQQKLFALDEEIVVLPGHGGETTIKQEKEFNPFVGARAGKNPWTP